jgi:hypothetical protein
MQELRSPEAQGIPRNASRQRSNRKTKRFTSRKSAQGKMA